MVCFATICKYFGRFMFSFTFLISENTFINIQIHSQIFKKYFSDLRESNHDPFRSDSTRYRNAEKAFYIRDFE